MDKYVVSTFENVTKELVEHMRRLHDDVTRLEATWENEKEYLLRRLKEETDIQVQDTRLKGKVLEDFEENMTWLKTKSTLEMGKVQDYFLDMEKITIWMKTNNLKWSDPKMRKKLQETTNVNKQLRLSLIEIREKMVPLENNLRLLQAWKELKRKESVGSIQSDNKSFEESSNVTGDINKSEPVDSADLEDVNARSEDSKCRWVSNQNECYLTKKKAFTSTFPCQAIHQYEAKTEDNESNKLKSCNQSIPRQFQKQRSLLRIIRSTLGIDPDVSRNPSSRKHNASESKYYSDENQDSSLKNLHSESSDRDSIPENKSFKIIIVGDKQVGKTSYILRLTCDTFLDKLKHTIGADIQPKLLEVDGHNVKLRLWDTAGEERFHSITMSYFRNVKGVLLLYDCTNQKSFHNVSKWMKDIRENCPDTVPVQIVGNKFDLRDLSSEGQKTVTKKDGMRLAKEFGATFIETSARSGYNITESAVNLARNIMIIQEQFSLFETSIVCLEEPCFQKKSECCV